MSTPTQRLSPEARDERAEILFYEALKQSPELRSGFLDEECGTNARLRAEVETLLQDHERAGSFLKADAPLSAELTEEFARLKPEEVGDRIGPYKLLELIGEGGFGRVWVAEQERPIRRRVALKIIKLGMDTREVMARFEQERQALALMDHPNIAKVHDAGATPLGRPFFVMELVRGIMITEYCDRAGLPTEARLKLFIQVCAAVQHAHQKGIIHRDLKPSNVLIGLHDGVPVPKVIDFGVAKATQQQRLTDLTVYTQFEQMIGTPLYMSPEQAELSALDVDTRSDIYSLGVLLYELLTGRTPFDPERLLKTGLDEMRRMIREEEPQKPSTLLSTMADDVRTGVAKLRDSDAAKLISTIRGDLDWIVMKALEKDRNRRYETANGLARDIERHLCAEPVQARPPTAGYRFARVVKRNKGVFAAGAAIAVTLLVGSGFSMWQAHRANSALSELRGSAPAFAAMARTLVAKDEINAAIEKLDVAIRLRPDVAEYLAQKADLLQSQLRFAEAEECYRAAISEELEGRHVSANADLCHRLALSLSVDGRFSREDLLELFALMRKEKRSPIQMVRIAKALGEESKLLLPYWKARLRDLPATPEKPIEERLTIDELGDLRLDLSSTEIDDLSVLEGMPLNHLNLTRCDRVTEIAALRGMPLRTLHLDQTEVVDLSPIAHLKRLKKLSLSRTKVRDLSALRYLDLEELDVTGSLVTDISALRGTPLRTLSISKTAVSDLQPLTDMPLTELSFAETNVSDIAALATVPLERLDCSQTQVKDFSPISAAKLKALSANDTGIADISFLSHMPLELLQLGWTLDISNLQVLASMHTLRELVLPELWLLSDEDLSAVRALKELPGLTSVVDGQGGIAKSPTTFWATYEAYSRSRSLTGNATRSFQDGEFGQAVRLLQEAVQAKPDNSGLHCALGMAQIAAGDLKAYQETCKLMIGRFRRRLAGDELTVRLCVVAPDPAVPIQELRRLMPHLALVRKSGPFYCWYVLTNGLLEYRDGRYLEAIKLLTEVESDRFESVIVSAESGLAMAYANLGDLAAAEAHFDHGQAVFQRMRSAHLGGSKMECEKLPAFVLFEEAKRVLNDARSSSVER